MKKCIYKITNLINNKVYIGQTNDFTRRMREHKNKMYGNCSKVLYDAINKYGWDNFTMEMIEDYCENYSERENYWIEFYNAKVPNGYNVDLTDLDYAGKQYLSPETVLEIYKDLQDLSLSYKDIAEKYELQSEQSIRDINKGKVHYNQNYIYPIRPTKNELSREKSLLIIEDLKNTDMLIKDIAEKYECSHAWISDINAGRRSRILADEEYPIRKDTRKGQRFSEEIISRMYDDIINTKMTWAELADKYSCGAKVFQHINVGQLHRKEGYTYPLRPSPAMLGAKKVPAIIELLRTTNLSYTAIAKEVGSNPTTVRMINLGKSYHQEDIQYPIRESK